MTVVETDYLVIGAGATGLALADTLLDETDAHITIVDRHGAPGGHRNDAYPFVVEGYRSVTSLTAVEERWLEVAVLAEGLGQIPAGPDPAGWAAAVERRI